MFVFRLFFLRGHGCRHFAVGDLRLQREFSAVNHVGPSKGIAPVFAPACRRSHRYHGAGVSLVGGARSGWRCREVVRSRGTDHMWLDRDLGACGGSGDEGAVRVCVLRKAAWRRSSSRKLKLAPPQHVTGVDDEKCPKSTGLKVSRRGRRCCRGPEGRARCRRLAGRPRGGGWILRGG